MGLVSWNFSWVSRTGKMGWESRAKGQEILDRICTAGKLALSFTISDTFVLFKPFWFQHFLTKDLHSLPHLASPIHAHLQGQRKMTLWFSHWVSWPYLAYLSWLPPMFGCRICQRGQARAVWIESSEFWGLERGFASCFLLHQMPQKGFWRHLLSFCTQRTDFPCVQHSFGAWLVSWNCPSFSVFLTCPMVWS